jgi:hypothetical protein
VTVGSVATFPEETDDTAGRNGTADLGEFNDT